MARKASITWTLPDGQAQSIEFDAVVRDTHESSAEVPEHTIEKGANISDHIRPNLDSVTIQAVVSNTPIRQPGTQMDGVRGRQIGLEIVGPRSPPFVGALGAAARVIAGGGNVVLAKANVLNFTDQFDRVRTVYEELLNLEKDGTVIGIVTSLREYENMVIRRISPVREAASSNALVVTIEATEIRIVDSEIVQAPEPVEVRGNRSSNQGQQNTDDADADTSERTSSYASQLVDLF